MIGTKDILINCNGFNFVRDKSIMDRTVTIEDLLEMCEDLYLENQKLIEEKEEILQDMEDNFRRIDPAEQYGISDSDFI